MRNMKLNCRAAPIVGALLSFSMLLTACGGDGETGESSPAISSTASAGSPAAVTPTDVVSSPTVRSSPAALSGSPERANVGVEQCTYEVVDEFPHDPDAFTQGLVYEDGRLFEGTGLYGESTLREVDLETGDVLRSQALSPELFGEGITLRDGRIFQITWQSQTAIVYDAETFEEIERFSYTTEGWGITDDGQRLYMSDGTSTISIREPDTFNEIDRIEVSEDGEPVDNLNELEWIDGQIYANVWQTDEIVRIDPATGDVTARIDLTGLLSSEDQAGLVVDVLNGIAWDEEGQRLFVTGKLWPKLYEITLDCT